MDTIGYRVAGQLHLHSKTIIFQTFYFSFPGGKRDKEDKNLVETAVRETVEELGIEQNKIDVWGPMIPMPDRVRYTVTKYKLRSTGLSKTHQLTYKSTNPPTN